jgi:hypothetical protein
MMKTSALIAGCQAKPHCIRKRHEKRSNSTVGSRFSAGRIR